METKETSLGTVAEERLIRNDEYFKYIFKKTEKIACAVFYILRSDSSISHDDLLIADLENASRTLSDVSLESLKCTALQVREEAIKVSHALMRLETKLRIAHAAHFLSTEHLEVFLHEIQSVQRSLRRYMEEDTKNMLLMNDIGLSAPEEHKTRKPRIAQNPERAEGGAGSLTGQSRRDRVLEVLRDKGQASIKDIVEVVSDCSEKTIQRELNNLIKDNIIRREGERRWSKYMLI